MLLTQPSMPVRRFIRTTSYNAWHLRERLRERLVDMTKETVIVGPVIGYHLDVMKRGIELIIIADQFLKWSESRSVSRQWQCFDLQSHRTGSPASVCWCYTSPLVAVFWLAQISAGRMNGSLGAEEAD